MDQITINILSPYNRNKETVLIGKKQRKVVFISKLLSTAIFNFLIYLFYF